MTIRIFSADAGTILFRLPHRIADVLGLLFDGIRRSGYFFFYGMFYVRRMLLDAVGYIRNLFGRPVDAGIDFPFYLLGLFLDAVVHGCKF